MQTSTKVDLKGATGPGGQGNVQSSGRTAGEMTRPFQRQEWLGCAIIALCFAGWGLRSVGGYNIIETDAARHAMNGVFLRDLVASGHFTDVLPFARAYYAHLPALSMPYHPPLPLIEAVFFAIFGVNALAARLAIGLTVFLSGVILFRLAHASNQSLALSRSFHDHIPLSAGGLVAGSRRHAGVPSPGIYPAGDLQPAGGR